MTSNPSHAVSSVVRQCGYLIAALSLALMFSVGCASPSQGISTSKEQGDKSVATDQQVQQSGLFNFAKTTSSAMISGGSILFAMMTLVYMNHRANNALVMELVDIIRRMIPLINVGEGENTADQ